MMEKETCVEQLISYLLDVLPEYRAEAETVPMDAPARRYLLRCLMNVWDPRRKLPEAYFALEQQLLSAETQEKRRSMRWLFQKKSLASRSGKMTSRALRRMPS